MDEALPSTPIGTIVAFAGELDTGWLKQQGWLYCNGAILDKAEYRDLYAAVGTNYGGARTTFNLPDLRGRFLRGCDLHSGNDPYVETRGPSADGGVSSDSPGSLQGFYSARPVKSFIAAEAGGHCHTVPHAPVDNNAYAIAGAHYGIWTDDNATTSTAGNHDHTLDRGGDAETRPINANVFFIIKFADVASEGGH